MPQRALFGWLVKITVKPQKPLEFMEFESPIGYPNSARTGGELVPLLPFVLRTAKWMDSGRRDGSMYGLGNRVRSQFQTANATSLNHL